MSSKKVLNENKDKYQPHERRLFGLIKTQIIKTNKMKNVRQTGEFILKYCEGKGQKHTDRL